MLKSSTAQSSTQSSTVQQTVTHPSPAALSVDHYWLRNAHVSASLLGTLTPDMLDDRTREDLCRIDVEICNGTVCTILPSGSGEHWAGDLGQETDEDRTPLNYDLRGGMVFPCFVDMHTHLDKGHIWNRAPNPDGTFASAMAMVRADSTRHWDANDLYRRMNFGLQCSYAHGTQAIRTHIDAWGEQANISFGVLEVLQREWSDRLLLQAVCLVPLDVFSTPEGEVLADRVATLPGGILGGLALVNPELDRHLDRVMQLAQERGLDLDFHADETLDPASDALRHIAEAALRNQFTGRITCGHCCSLSTQPLELLDITLTLLQRTTIGIVSLPMCNLYLQDRQMGRTPRYRGVTAIQELRCAGIPVAIASDNCRDPFYNYGDHDMLEVLMMGSRIAQLDAPYGDLPRMVTATPALLMGLDLGLITVGMAADLVLFRGRSFSELLSRSQHDRTVLRRGRAIETTLPDYAVLDDLVSSEE